jgi:hypothetical protein
MDEDLFCTKRFLVIISIPVATRKPRFLDLENSIGLVHTAKAGLCIRESLGKELGLYSDPYQYFRMLVMKMHRAIRLVVDTGLHSKVGRNRQLNIL